MNEQEFETFLAGAYRAPSERPQRPELALAVLARVERRQRSRTVVLGLAAVIGVGVAGAAFAATGLGDVLMGLAAHAPPAPAMIDPSIVVAVGLVLMLAAVARNALREL
jgi:hypothetical protein